MPTVDDYKRTLKDLAKWLWEEKERADRAEAERDAARAEVERLRDALHKASNDSEYTRAVVLLSEIGMLLALADVNKMRVFRPWLEKQTRLLQTPRARSALKLFIDQEASDGAE